MLIENARIIYPDHIEAGSIRIENGIIASINPTQSYDSDILDAKGLYLSPGFIDIHIHGASGHDTMDASCSSLCQISKAVAQHGTTSFVPTTMTMDKGHIRAALKCISNAKKAPLEGAKILGCHLEGPFINKYKAGAQDEHYVLSPSIKEFLDIAGDNINTIIWLTLAPEVPGALELVHYLSCCGIKTSIGHTNADYEQAMDGIIHGISHSTHLYNAMSPFHHRNPGAIGAVFDSDITTEIIADGIHVSYPAIRTALKIKGIDKTILITDAMMACTIPDGDYSLGGQRVIAKGNEARLENGSLAGSVLTLDKAIRNIKNNTSYSLEKIVRMATLNPAIHCGVQDHKGSIAKGMDADLVLFDEDINIKKVIIKGRVFK